MSEAQVKVTFQSSDGVTVTADVYGQDKSLPYILLFHQANFSRGEYNEIAPKLQKLGFNCVAVDLRAGKEVNFIQNETAQSAKLKNYPCEYLDADKDLLAAIEYVKSLTKERIVLFGSSYSASLVLKDAVNNRNISAVVAFSPGEYFSNMKIKDIISKLDKPVLLACTSKEEPFVKEMVSGINSNLITWCYPGKSGGTHGAKALWSATPDSNDCWMQLLMFFKRLKK